MATRVKVKNAESGSIVEMDVEPTNLIEEVIESAASYWEKPPGAYVLRRGKSLLRGQQTVLELGIISGDVLELIPDPEGG